MASLQWQSFDRGVITLRFSLMGADESAQFGESNLYVEIKFH